MVTIYKVNGKEFNTYEEAKAYEEELERKEQERIEKEQKKKERLDELCNATNEYIRLKEEFEKDYGTIGNGTNNDINKVLKIKEYADIVDNMLKFFY